MMAAQDGCHSWVKSLSLTSLWSRLKAEPKDLAVLLKPRTAAKLVSPGLGTVLWISSSWGGAIPFGLGQASPPELRVLSALAQGLSCWLKEWLRGFPVDSGQLVCGSIPSSPQERPSNVMSCRGLA